MKNELLESITTIFQLLIKSLIFGILPFFIFIVITSRTSAFGGIRSFVVLTGSMEPTLPVGSIILTKNFEAYSPGDVVAFKSGNVNVTHRIIDVEQIDGQIQYKTQGDANAAPDGQKITGDKILGKTFYHIPIIGKISIFLKTVPGFLLMVILPAVIFIIFELMNIKNELTKDIEKNLMQKMQTA